MESGYRDSWQTIACSLPEHGAVLLAVIVTVRLRSDRHRHAVTVTVTKLWRAQLTGTAA